MNPFPDPCIESERNVKLMYVAGWTVFVFQEPVGHFGDDKEAAQRGLDKWREKIGDYVLHVITQVVESDEPVRPEYTD